MALDVARRQVMQKHDIRQPRALPALPNVPDADGDDLHDFFDHIDIGHHSLAEDGTILDVNRAELELLGYTRAEYVGRNAADFFGDRGDAQDLLGRLAAGKAVRDFEARLVARDGSIVAVLIDSSVVRRRGRWIGTRCLVRDNRARKREQEQLDERERAYHRLLESLPGAFVWAGDIQGRITYVNSSFLDFTGLTMEGVRAGKWLASVHADDRQRTAEDWALILAAGEARDVVNRFVSRDGAVRWFLTRGVPIRGENGAIVSWLAMSTDIDDQKRIEEAAQLGEQRWRTLASSLPGIIGTWSPAGEPLFLNDRWFEYTGLTREGMTAADVRGVFHPQEVTAIEELFRESLRTGAAFTIEGRIRRHDGVYRWHLGSVAPIRDDAGTIKAWVSSIIDIDEAKQAEQAVRRSEKRFRQLADAMPQIVWTATPDGAIDYVNRRWFDVFGSVANLNREEIWSTVVNPDDAARALRAWRKAISEGTPYEVENRYRHPTDGRFRWYLTRALPVRDDDGRVVRWFGTSTDIDDRKRVEQALRVSEERFRQLADAMPQIVWTARPDGFVDYFNNRWYEFVGRVEGEGKPGDWLGVVHPEDGQTSLDAWKESLETGNPFQMKERLREGATGRYRWHLSRALPVRDEAGEIVRWFGTSTDIEELVRAEQALTDESRVVESLQAIGVTLTAELDLHKVVQRVIESATALTGAAFGVFFYNLVGEEGETVTRYALAGADGEAFQDLPLPRETRLFAPSLSGKQTQISDDVTKDPRYGQNPPYFGWPEAHPSLRSYLSVPVASRSGEVLGALFFGHPEPAKFGVREERIAAGIAGWAAVAVDNARLFEASERNAEELKKANAAKDEFLGLVSHELKTPITTIFGNAEVLRRRFDRLDEESRTAALADISNEAERLHRIIDNLLVLARLERGQAINAEPLLIRRLIDPIVAEHRRRFPYRTIDVDAPRDVLPISGEPVYVEQVVRNLLSNAEKYSPPDKPIEVRIRRVRNSIEVSVLDRGRGFAPEEAELIFTPFYRSPRTADVASGVGVGLAVCKRLVEAQDGKIWARPRKDGGADIGFSLPLAD